MCSAHATCSTVQLRQIMRGLSTLTYNLATNFARYDTCGHTHRLCIVPEPSMSCLAVGAAQILLLERKLPLTQAHRFCCAVLVENLSIQCHCAGSVHNACTQTVQRGGVGRTLLKALHSASQRKVARASTFRIRCFFRLRDVLSAVSWIEGKH